MGPRAGLDGRKISLPPGFDPRTVQLYRMTYPAHIIPNKVDENLKLSNLRPDIHSNTESTNTEYMASSEKVFGRTVNTKCLVWKTRTV